MECSALKHHVSLYRFNKILNRCDKKIKEDDNVYRIAFS